MTNNDANHVVVDGSNIAYEGRDQPSLRQLDEAVRAFLKEHPHDVLTVVVDATFAHRIDDSEKAEYEAAIENGEVITPPAGAIGRGDAFVLEIAERTDATVLSNDSFQEFHGEHAWLFDEERLIGGKPIPDVGWVFVYRSPVRGPTSRRAVQDAKKSGRGNQSDKSSGNGGGNGNSRGRGRNRGGGGDTKKADDAKSSSSGRSRSRSRGQGGNAKAEPKQGGSSSNKDASRQGASKQPASKRSASFDQLVKKHPIGSSATGTVVNFASHGAHLEIDGVKCYLPLASMGDPPPNSAREVLNDGDEVDVIVDQVNEKFENLDLALPGFESGEAKSASGSRPASGGDESTDGGGRKRRRWFGKKSDA